MKRYIFLLIIYSTWWWRGGGGISFIYTYFAWIAQWVFHFSAFRGDFVVIHSLSLSLSHGKFPFYFIRKHCAIIKLVCYKCPNFEQCDEISLLAGRFDKTLCHTTNSNSWWRHCVSVCTICGGEIVYFPKKIYFKYNGFGIATWKVIKWPFKVHCFGIV